MKLHKSPPGTPRASRRPLSDAGTGARVPVATATRSHSFSEALGGRGLRAAAKAAVAQVNGSITGLRRRGAEQLRSVLQRSHSMPPGMARQQAGRPEPDPDALPVPDASQPKHFVLDGVLHVQYGSGVPRPVPVQEASSARPAPTAHRPVPPTPRDVARAQLSREFAWAHLLHLADRPFDVVTQERERVEAVQRQDVRMLDEQRARLLALQVSAIRVNRGLAEKYRGTPQADEVQALLDEALRAVMAHTSHERLAIHAARARIAPQQPPPLPPRPGTHELP